MSSKANAEAISDAVLEVVSLFEERSDRLRFPDLSLEVLMEHCERVHTRHAALEEAEAAYREAQRALDEERGALKAAAQRGIAYASIYAETDEALGERLRELRLAQPSKPSARGRAKRKKSAPPQDGLFEAPAAPAASAGEAAN